MGLSNTLISDPTSFVTELKIILNICFVFIGNERENSAIIGMSFVFLVLKIFIFLGRTYSSTRNKKNSFGKMEWKFK